MFENWCHLIEKIWGEMVNLQKVHLPKIQLAKTSTKWPQDSNWHFWQINSFDKLTFWKLAISPSIHFRLLAFGYPVLNINKTINASITSFFKETGYLMFLNKNRETLVAHWWYPMTRANSLWLEWQVLEQKNVQLKACPVSTLMLQPSWTGSIRPSAMILSNFLWKMETQHAFLKMLILHK